MTIPMISPTALQQKLTAGEPAEVIDVRSGAEFQAIHATPARHIPLETLNPAEWLNKPNAAPLYILCQGGGRAKTACERLQAAGLANAIVVEGGTRAWEAAGLPVVRGRQILSLERQVRIVVGAGALIGALLALTVNVKFALIPAFFGAGLLFAGLTDKCGLAVLLARMPWNKGTGPVQSCSVKRPA